jgi:molybdenum cofactor cytidylyltransferase
MELVGILLAAGRGRRDPSGVQNKLLQPLATGEPSWRPVRASMLAVPRVLAVVRVATTALARCWRSLVARCASAIMLTMAWPLP